MSLVCLQKVKNNLYSYTSLVCVLILLDNAFMNLTFYLLNVVLGVNISSLLHLHMLIFSFSPVVSGTLSFNNTCIDFILVIQAFE